MDSALSIVDQLISSFSQQLLQKPTELDLSVFEVEKPIECNDYKTYQQCPSIARLAVSLKYYSALDISNNEIHRDIFHHFITTLHQTMLDDYIHFIKNHGHQIENINKYFLTNLGFKDCNINDCRYSSRHHRVDNLKSIAKTTKIDSSFNFHLHTLDSLHFYVFHIFDAGLRTLSSNANEELKFNQEEMSDEYFDKEFAKLKQKISEKEENTKSFRRFRRGNNSKFTMQTQSRIIF